MSDGSPRPWIGVSTYHREREGRPRFTLPSAYVDAVREAGGVPLLLPPGEHDVGSLVERLDGLVLSGGGDLEPTRAGSGDHAATYYVCPERDDFETALVEQALAQRLPTLAICRGAQVLNVALGGTIHAHLPDVVGDAIVHRRSQDEAAVHPVRVRAGTRLAGIVGSTEIAKVASWHHQAVDRLGDGLRPVAWAADGTVEALEVDGAPQILAVQWHPELDRAVGAPQGVLFEALVQDAGRRCAARAQLAASGAGSD